MRNRLKRVSLVELPVSSLEVLDLSQCNLRLISPFLVSMFEKEREPKVKNRRYEEFKCECYRCKKSIESNQRALIRS